MSLDREREHWQRVKSLLAEAMELPAHEREHLLLERCGDDVALYSEVARLLELHGTETLSFEHAPLIANLAQLRSSALVVGATIGAWTLERELGQGGMGSVWLAQRTTASFRQLAAIKVIRGIASDTLMARLRGERQALASLNHPNIAHLIDGGETSDGAPYIVMEYVDGLPIDVWCQSRQLDVRACLQLMMQLSVAVAHAHEHLLVHRDIKPSNVLVNAEGQVKLLDFGVVKLLAPDGDVRAATEFSERALTPEFASPEQVQGNPVTLATDVYGLGATLYCMLTGASPFGRGNRDPFAMLKAVVEQPPTRASVTARQHAVEPGNPDHSRWQSLRGDVDTIVMKALAKNPAARYSTARDFGRDIQAHLDGYPIAAQRPTWGYVAWKFVTRNRLASVAMGGALASLLAGLFGALHQADVASTQRDLAQSEQARATAALAVAEQERGRTATALLAEQRSRSAADAATAHAELQRSAALASANAARVALRTAEAQRLLAASRFSEVRDLANRVVNEYADDMLGTYGTSQTRLKIVNDSVKFLDRLRKDANGDPGLLSELSRGYRKLAFALSGDASVRDYPRATEQLALARTLRVHVVKVRGLTQFDIAELALIDVAEGDLAWRHAQFTRARVLLERARQNFASLHNWKFNDPWDRVAPARALLSHALSLLEPGANAQTGPVAARLLDESEATIAQILLIAPGDPVARHQLSEVHWNRAQLLRQNEQLTAAEVQFDRSEHLASELVNRFPNNAIYAQLWSQVLGSRSILRMLQGRDEAGIADGLKRAELATVVRSRDPDNPQAILTDLTAWYDLCSNYMRVDKEIAVFQPVCQRALESARAMLAVRQGVPFVMHANTAMIVAGLAGVKSALVPVADPERIASALQTQQEGLIGITQRTPPVSDAPQLTAWLVQARINVAEGLELAGRHTEATRMHEEDLLLIAAMRKANVTEEHPTILTLRTQLRMAHNFRAQADRGNIPAADRTALLARSAAAAQSYLAAAANARARGHLGPRYERYIPEIEQLAKAGS